MTHQPEAPARDNAAPRWRFGLVSAPPLFSRNSGPPFCMLGAAKPLLGKEPPMWISGTPTDLRQGLTRRDWLRVGLGGGLASLVARPAWGQPAGVHATGFGQARSCIL